MWYKAPQVRWGHQVNACVFCVVLLHYKHMGKATRPGARMDDPVTLMRMRGCKMAGVQCHCLAVTHRKRPCAASSGLQRALVRPAGGGQRSVSYSATAASVICPPGYTDVRVAVGKGEVDLQNGFCGCIQRPSASWSNLLPVASQADKYWCSCHLINSAIGSCGSYLEWLTPRFRAHANGLNPCFGFHQKPTRSRCYLEREQQYCSCAY